MVLPVPVGICSCRRDHAKGKGGGGVCVGIQEAGWLLPVQPPVASTLLLFRYVHRRRHRCCLRVVVPPLLLLMLHWLVQILQWCSVPMHPCCCCSCTSHCWWAHLQQAVSPSVQGSFELQHVPVLLRVDVLIRKVHRQPFQLELHPA